MTKLEIIIEDEKKILSLYRTLHWMSAVIEKGPLDRAPPVISDILEVIEVQCGDIVMDEL